MSALIAALLKTPTAWVALVVCGVLAATGLQTLRLHHALRALQAARAANLDPGTGQPWAKEAASCANAVDVARTALARSQDATRALAAESAHRMAVSKAALAEAEAGQRAAGVRADEVLRAKPGADVCKAADALILRSVAP